VVSYPRNNIFQQNQYHKTRLGHPIRKRPQRSWCWTRLSQMQGWVLEIGAVTLLDIDGRNAGALWRQRQKQAGGAAPTIPA